MITTTKESTEMPESEEEQTPSVEDKLGFKLEPQFYISSLEQKVASLTQENLMLQGAANQVQSENMELRKQLDESNKLLHGKPAPTKRTNSKKGKGK